MKRSSETLYKKQYGSFFLPRYWPTEVSNSCHCLITSYKLFTGVKYSGPESAALHTPVIEEILAVVLGAAVGLHTSGKRVIHPPQISTGRFKPGTITNLVPVPQHSAPQSHLVPVFNTTRY